MKRTLTELELNDQKCHTIKCSPDLWWKIKGLAGLSNITQNSYIVKLLAKHVEEKGFLEILDETN